MSIHQGSELSIADLLQEAYSAPDFSFLQGWPEDSSFFPRLNGASVESFELKKEKRVELSEAVVSVQRLQPLIAETEIELRSSKGSFSNSISVFHRDGEVSVVAIPVNSDTRKSLGGFLLAKELLANSNADRFFSELRDLPALAHGAQRALDRNWWQRRKEEHSVDMRRAAQLLLAAKSTGPAQLSRILELLESRISTAAGATAPSVSDWQQALLKLEALKELPSDAIVSSLQFTEVRELRATLQVISEGFARLDRRRRALESSLEKLKAHKIEAHASSYTLDEFAKRLKGRGFPRKALEGLILDHRKYMVGAPGSDQKATTGEVTLGEVLRMKKELSWIFRTSTQLSAVQLIETYMEDQKELLSYPRLTDSGEAFDDFLTRAHELYLEQQRPYPVRAQFEVLHRLLQNSPEELHLVARDSDALKRLIGSVSLYSDADRAAKLSRLEEISGPADAREFFATNPASFQSVLSNLGFNSLTLEQISGFLAPELTTKIRNIDLDLAGMKSQLRSYQTFGVQYALHQQRVILGDEMGLGKTVTALALAKHLTNEGGKRILVVSPLAVLENWRREILKHTDYEPRVLYGKSLEGDLATWIADGGIAIATFESVQRVSQKKLLEELLVLDLTVIDEAHFLKNSKTKRTRAVLPWIRGAARALLMTGTPMENSLDEFVTLISYVQPHLELPEDTLAHTEFRKAIAPVYLRRNQIDVLQELPELQDEEDFIELSEADAEYYRRALTNSDWHQSRRAKVLAGNQSSTVQRIQDIVKESVANGHKVLIFSFYRETIDVLRNCLSEDDPYLPLTGALSSLERQLEVDKFTEAKEPGVLLAQATAGGTGLNIQAASVVIIVEPQTKPSLEDQMVGRSHRMGQTKAVRVIRLRGKDTLDERWVDMLQGKRKIFDATAGVSDAAALDSAMDNSNIMKQLLEDERKAWGL